MLDILQFFFESDAGFEDPDGARISAERILDIMEHTGMRPPILLNQKYNGPLEGWENENKE